MSFSNAQKMLRLGKIKVNGEKCKDNITLKYQDIIEICEIKKAIPDIATIYEDENILVIDKPAGIECATADKSSENTYSLEEIFEAKNAIVVHRLDRMTEGLVLLAKSKDNAKKFKKIIENKEMVKKYYACVEGIVKDEEGGVKRAYLKKNKIVYISDKKTDEYKEIITEFYIKKIYDDFTLVDIILHTGRTHQIRAYFSHIGHAVLGDNKYSENKHILRKKCKGYFLCAYSLSFDIKDTSLKYLNDKTFDITPTFFKYINV